MEPGTSSQGNQANLLRQHGHHHGHHHHNHDSHHGHHGHHHGHLLKSAPGMEAGTSSQGNQASLRHHGPDAPRNVDETWSQENNTLRQNSGQSELNVNGDSSNRLSQESTTLSCHDLPQLDAKSKGKGKAKKNLGLDFLLKKVEKGAMEVETGKQEGIQDYQGPAAKNETQMKAGDGLPSGGTLERAKKSLGLDFSLKKKNEEKVEEVGPVGGEVGLCGGEVVLPGGEQGLGGGEQGLSGGEGGLGSVERVQEDHLVTRKKSTLERAKKSLGLDFIMAKQAEKEEKRTEEGGELVNVVHAESENSVREVLDTNAKALILSKPAIGGQEVARICVGGREHVEEVMNEEGNRDPPSLTLQVEKEAHPIEGIIEDGTEEQKEMFDEESEPKKKTTEREQSQKMRRNLSLGFMLKKPSKDITDSVEMVNGLENNQIMEEVTSEKSLVAETAEDRERVKQMLAREDSQSSLSSPSVDLAGQTIQEKKKSLSLGFMLTKPSEEITEAAKKSDESNQGVHEKTDDDIHEQVTQSSLDGKDQRVKEKKKNLSLGFMLRKPSQDAGEKVNESETGGQDARRQDHGVKAKKENLSLGFMLRKPLKQTTDGVKMTNMTNMKSLDGEESLQVITFQIISLTFVNVS